MHQPRVYEKRDETDEVNEKFPRTKVELCNDLFVVDVANFFFELIVLSRNFSHSSRTIVRNSCEELENDVEQEHNVDEHFNPLFFFKDRVEWGETETQPEDHMEYNVNHLLEDGPAEAELPKRTDDVISGLFLLIFLL